MTLQSQQACLDRVFLGIQAPHDQEIIALPLYGNRKGRRHFLIEGVPSSIFKITTIFLLSEAKSRPICCL